MLSTYAFLGHGAHACRVGLYLPSSHSPAHCRVLARTNFFVAILTSRIPSTSQSIPSANNSAILLKIASKNVPTMRLGEHNHSPRTLPVSSTSPFAAKARKSSVHSINSTTFSSCPPRTIRAPSSLLVLFPYPPSSRSSTGKSYGRSAKPVASVVAAALLWTRSLSCAYSNRTANT